MPLPLGEFFSGLTLDAFSGFGLSPFLQISVLPPSSLSSLGKIENSWSVTFTPTIPKELAVYYPVLIFCTLVAKISFVCSWTHTVIIHGLPRPPKV